MNAKPLGRRPGTESSRNSIIDAARQEFAAKGFERATIRSIAAAAGVDPATIYHFFDGKDDLLAAVLEFPVDADTIRRLLAPDGPVSGEEMLSTVLAMWQQPEVAEKLTALIRVAVTQPAGGAAVSSVADRTIWSPLVEHIGGADAELRVALTASQIIGLAMLRFVLPFAPIAGASVDDLVAMVSPTIQRYLTGDLGSTPAADTGEPE